MKKSPKNILISAPFGYSIKNLLYSTFWQSESVRQAEQIYILTPVPEVWEKYLETIKVKNVQPILFKAERKFNFIFSAVWQTKKTLFLDRTKSSTQEIRWRILRQENILLYFIKKIILSLFFWVPFSFLDFCLAVTTPKDNFHLDKIDVWLSLAPSFEIETVVSRYIDRFHRRAKKIAFIHSWDNLSSKGSLIRKYDKILVWGDLMEKEVREKLNYGRADVVRVGMPQYDLFYQYKNQSVGGVKKQFLYATGHPETVPNELAYVAEVAQRINQAFPEYKLIIRVHPNDDMARYKNLQKKYKNIEIENPGQRTAKTYDKWMPNYDDIKHFADLLKNSQAVINIASTVTIDTSYFLTPVVLLDYDRESGYLKDSIKRFYQYEHFKKIIETKGVFTVKAKDELESVLKQALSSKNDRRRKELIGLYDPFGDGQGGQRIGDAL